jgi:O-antigen/teichoic acid export membrane protein
LVRDVPELPRRFLRNSISNYLNTGTAAVLALVMTPVLANGLGPERYGIWAFAASLALYLELFEFGFGAATIRYIASYSAVGDMRMVRRTITTSFWTLAVPGLLALVLGGAVAWAFPAIFDDLDAETAHAAQVVILLVSLDLAISIPGDTFGGTLLGMQRYDLTNATLIVTAIAQAIGWVIVLSTGGDLVELAIVTVALSLLGQLSRFVIAHRLVDGISLAPRHFDRGLIKPFAKLSVWLAVTEASLLAVARLDTIIVGLVVGLPAAGIYAVGQKIPLAVNMLLGPTTKLFYPHSADLAARRETGVLRSAFVLGNRLSLALALPLCLAFGLLATPVLDAWVGEDFLDAAPVVTLLLGAIAVWSVTRIGLLMLQGMGEAKTPALIHLAEAVINVVLSVVLGLAFGLTGVALATLIAAVVTNLGAFVPFLCRRFGVPLGDWALAAARAHVPPLLVAGAVGVFALSADPEGLVAVTAAVTAVLAAYVLAFAVSGVSRDELRRLRAAIAR